jgi:hypothetical protein
MSLITRHCPHCQDDRPFEHPHEPASCPDLSDSPDGDCPELACVGCGTALVAGLAVPGLAWPAVGSRADSPERAA